MARKRHEIMRGTGRLPREVNRPGPFIRCGYTGKWIREAESVTDDYGTKHTRKRPSDRDHLLENRRR